MNELMEKAEKGDKMAIVQLIKYLISIDRDIAKKDEQLVQDCKNFIAEVKQLMSGKKDKKPTEPQGAYIS